VDSILKPVIFRGKPDGSTSWILSSLHIRFSNPCTKSILITVGPEFSDSFAILEAHTVRVNFAVAPEILLPGDFYVFVGLKSLRVCEASVEAFWREP